MSLRSLGATGAVIRRESRLRLQTPDSSETNRQSNNARIRCGRAGLARPWRVGPRQDRAERRASNGDERVTLERINLVLGSRQSTHERCWSHGDRSRATRPHSEASSATSALELAAMVLSPYFFASVHGDLWRLHAWGRQTWLPNCSAASESGLVAGCHGSARLLHPANSDWVCVSPASSPKITSQVSYSIHIAQCRRSCRNVRFGGCSRLRVLRGAAHALLGALLELLEEGQVVL